MISKRITECEGRIIMNHHALKMDMTCARWKPQVTPASFKNS